MAGVFLSRRGVLNYRGKLVLNYLFGGWTAQDADFIQPRAREGLETSGWSRARTAAAEGASGAMEVEVSTPLVGARVTGENSSDAVSTMVRARLSH